MRSSVSIALFFLISAFFLATLLGALEHSRKLLAAAGGCLAAVVCIIVFLTPVDLPEFRWGRGDDKPNAGASSTVVSTALTSSTTARTTSTISTTSTTRTTIGGPSATAVSGVQPR